MKNLLRVTTACCASALLFTAATTQAQNLLVNGSFEDAGGFTANPAAPGGAGANLGWASSFGPNSSVQSATYAQNGSSSLQVSLAVGQDWNPAGTYSVVSGVNVGVSYSLTGYYYAPAAPSGNFAGAGPIDIQLQFLDASLGNLATIETGWSALASLGAWNSFSVSGAAPAGTAYASVYLMFMRANATGTDSIYFDNVSLQAVPEPSTIAMFGFGTAALLAIRRRKN